MLLVNGTIAAVLLGVGCWAAHHAYRELSYAEVADIEIRRDTIDPERVVLHYRPLSSGTIGFPTVGRAFAERVPCKLDCGRNGRVAMGITSSCATMRSP